MIRIDQAPPFATVQDLGWRSGRAFGLPRSGAMDPTLLAMANTLAGNSPGAAAIEWALGGGTLEVDRDCTMAVLGAEAVFLSGVRQDPEHPVLHPKAGETLTIVPGRHHRFVYIAPHGGIDVPEILGSRSTYLPGGFGGFEGRRLAAGDLLPVGPSPPIELGSQVHPRYRAAPALTQTASDIVVRVMPGPQWDRFAEEARSAFLAARFEVTAASDRMGYRLQGPSIVPKDRATLPSEAACPGAIQIPDGGQPIVIMPDGPTVGGYAKIAVVAARDLRLVAQAVPGRIVRFSAVEIRAA